MIKKIKNKILEFEHRINVLASNDQINFDLNIIQKGVQVAFFQLSIWTNSNKYSHKF